MEQAGGRAASGAACGHQAPDALCLDPGLAAHGAAFLKAAQVSWSRLTSRSRLAIRACCCEGWELHDRMWTDVRVTFAARWKSGAGGAADESSGHSQQHHERQQRDLLHDTRGKDPEQLAQELGAAVARGARPRSLAVHFSFRNGPVNARLQELQL